MADGVRGPEGAGDAEHPAGAQDEPRVAAPLRPRQRFRGLSQEAVTAIGELLGVEAKREPYEPGPGEPVYALRHRSETGTLRLVCWPSLARVDVTCGPHAWIAKAIKETEVIAGLEVIFRFGEGSPEEGGTMFVGVGGDVMMVSGATD